MRWLLLLALTGCPTPVTPAPFDAGDGGRTPCQTDQLIGPSRLIRAPDGSAVTVPCHE